MSHARAAEDVSVLIPQHVLVEFFSFFRSPSSYYLAVKSEYFLITDGPRVCIYARERSFFETSGAAGYSHLGSVVWAGVGSVDFTPIYV